MEKETGATLRTAKLLQTAFIIATCIYVFILSLAQTYLDIRVFPPGDSTLGIVEIVLIILSVITLALGFF